MANRFEELPLCASAREFWDAVTAILDRPGLRRDHALRDQIERANDSIDANLREGFEQPTDAAFANFVFISKGSAAEVVARVDEARRKGYIGRDELAHIQHLGDHLGKMMGGFIKYLYASGFTDRGRHSVAPSAPKPLQPRRRRRR